MKFNFKTKTTIRYNGREYSSLEELPEPVRAAYARMVEQRDSGTGGTHQTTEVTVGTPPSAVVVKRSVVFNGKKFASMDEMPEADRKVYNDVMQLVRDSAATDHKSSDDGLLNPPSRESVSAQGYDVTETARHNESGWLTPKQKKLVAVVAGLILIAALLIALRAL